MSTDLNQLSDDQLLKAAQTIGVDVNAVLSGGANSVSDIKPAPEPVIDLKSGDSNVSTLDRIKGGTFFPTDSRQQEQFLQGQGYQTQRGPDGELLASKDGQPFRPVQQALSAHPLSELGTRLASGGGELVKMVGMGAGALGGGLAGLSLSPVGGLITAAAGAGAGYSAGGRAMAELGSLAAGIPEESNSALLTEGAKDFAGGGLGELAGPYVGKGLEKVAGAMGQTGQAISNFLRDKLDKVQAYSKLADIFQIPKEKMGQGVMEAAAQGVKAPVPYELNVENPIHEVFDHLNPIFHEAIPRAAAAGEPELVSLGKILGQRTEQAGEMVGDSVSKLSEAPKGKAISLTSLQDFAQKAIDKIKQEGGKLNSIGENIGDQGTRIDDKIGGDVRNFVDGFTTKASSKVQELEANKLILENRIKNEAAVSTANVPNPGSAEELQKLEVELLQAKAQATDPKGTFQDFWNFKRLIQEKGSLSYQGKNNTPDLAESYGQFGGAVADELERMALEIDPAIGTKYAADAKDFSLFSDAQKLTARAVGEAAMQKGPITGLAKNPGRILTDSATGISRLIRSKVIGGIKGAVFERYTPPPLTPSEEFAQAARILPTTAEQHAATMYRGARFDEMAREAGNRPFVRMMTGTTISSRAINLFIPPNASADANLGPLKDGITTSVLVDSGVVPPEAKETGFDVNQVPPQVMQQVNQSVMQVLQPLNDAIKFGDEDEIGAAYSQVVKQFPELFPPPKTGIKGEVVDSNGNVKLYDPTDRARYMSQVQVDSGMGWDEKAKVVSELNSTFTVLDPKKPK